MELELLRTYKPEGTNGKVLYLGCLVVYTIELPWKDNRAGVSCIPEGRYRLSKKWDLKFGCHLLVMNVPQRSAILVHPANDALLELKGCIAPVSVITGEGKGLRSRVAHEELISLVYGALDRRESVFLTVKSNPYEFG
ncbi:MAG TPA: DUF5675 family protein [Puia sp.]|nr:DUF5675 family protein [Puia sp.]